MFHTAVGGMGLIDNPSRTIKSVKWNQSETVTTWGGEGESRTSESNRVQIGQTIRDCIPIWESKNSGPGTDGKFGPGFFEDGIIEIDYDHRLLLIHRTLPNKAGDYQKLPLLIENGMLFIEGSSEVGGQEYPNRFLIHSGYGGALLVDDQFALDSQLGQKIKITDEQELKDSYGNVLKTKKGILPVFRLGELEFRDVSIGFFEGSIGRQKMSVLGGGLLKRFNLILDVEEGAIYVKSSQWKDRS